MATPTPLRRLGSLVVGFLGAGMLVLGSHVAIAGTGATLPSGSNVREGRVALDAPTVEAPIGEPIVFGEVRVRQEGVGSGPVDQDFSAIGGSERVRVTLGDETRELELPLPGTWKGPVQPEETSVEGLAGLPIITESAGEITERWPPPYILVQKALRRGDPLTLVFAGDTVSELWPGEREAIERWQTRQEQGRWPIVILLLIMAGASLLMSYRLFAGPGEPEG